MRRTNKAESSQVVFPVTAAWSTPLPETYARIGISRGPPRRQRGYRLYPPLMPGPWFKSVTPTTFRRLYLTQLEALDARQVLADLAALADNRRAALLCFEKAPAGQAWCHRGLVSVWLADALGARVVEYGHEKAGWGWAHPMLPADWRSVKARAWR